MMSTWPETEEQGPCPLGGALSIMGVGRWGGSCKAELVKRNPGGKGGILFGCRGGGESSREESESGRASRNRCVEEWK